MTLLTDQWFKDNFYVAGKDYGDFLVAVGTMTYGKGRIIIGDKFVVNNAWCYKTVTEALVAYAHWQPTEDNEPEGWFRNPITGQRRPN